MSRSRWQHRSRNRSLKAKKMTSRKTAHQETVHAGMAPAVKDEKVDEKVDGRVAVTADAWKLALKGVMARALNPAVAGAVAVAVVEPGEIGAIVRVKVKFKERSSNVNVLTPRAKRCW